MSYRFRNGFDDVPEVGFVRPSHGYAVERDLRDPPELALCAAPARKSDGFEGKLPFLCAFDVVALLSRHELGNCLHCFLQSFDDLEDR